MNNNYFKVRDFNKTEAKHHNRIIKLQDEYKLKYKDVLDSDTWATIETEVHNRLKNWKFGVGTRALATLINAETRHVIANSLEWHDIPKSYDTAFYISHYCKINEGMSDILQNFIDRGEI